MAHSPLYVGIDLGTTNSAAAVYDGARLEVVRNAQGSPLTPSVVRIDARGGVTVGARARKLLEADATGARAEFKRLMGTSTSIEFASAKVKKLPEELAAEILKSLRADVRDQTSVFPEAAVISVPALFELPQSRATSEAARLAGFTRVELIQEPIASALAAGWTADMGEGNWLVYDLGGGTFDVSLLETREGFLRVVGHDGDNYLGGRDLDWAIVDWILGEVRASSGVVITRADASAAPAIRKLKVAAEEAKIEAARGATAPIVVPSLVEGVDVDVVLDPETLERLCLPAVERSIAVCRRLLARHDVESTKLQRVVMVGGPTAMPFLRRVVKAALGAPFAEGVDPMTVVAQGAALFAATAGLDARPKAGGETSNGRALVLRYPPVAPDVEAHVVGRVADAKAKPKIDAVRVLPAGGGVGGEGAVEDDGTFVVSLSLLPNRPNVFRVETISAGVAAAANPSELTIVQGLTVGDPPLARSVGVALASNEVRVYFERGAALPARAVFTHRTVEALSAKGAGVLRIPIVQGESQRADLCRLVGAIEIHGADLERPLPAGTDVEVSVALDRGGRLTAQASIASIDRVFENVARLIVPEVPLDALAVALASIAKRTRELRVEVAGNATFLHRIAAIEVMLAEIDRDVAAATGGDEDAAQRARRALLDAEADLEEIALQLRFRDLSEEAVDRLADATSWIEHFGTPVERSLFEDLARSAHVAREKRRPLELERAMRRIRTLRNTAYLRHPEAWNEELEAAGGRIDRASDPKKASRLLEEGRAARKAGDRAGVERATRAIWELLPARDEYRALSYGSGLR